MLNAPTPVQAFDGGKLAHDRAPVQFCTLSGTAIDRSALLPYKLKRDACPGFGGPLSSSGLCHWQRSHESMPDHVEARGRPSCFVQSLMQGMVGW